MKVLNKNHDKWRVDIEHVKIEECSGCKDEEIPFICPNLQK